MKIRLHMREQPTPEQERIWLLSKINHQRHPGRTALKSILLVSAFILLIGLLAALAPRLHLM